MVEPRKASSTVTVIDHYCAVYRDLFGDVRSFEAFKYLHLGMISDLPRKSLPAIARAGQTHTKVHLSINANSDDFIANNLINQSLLRTRLTALALCRSRLCYP